MNPWFVIFIIAVALELVWLLTLIMVLDRKHWNNDTDRIVWIIVVCTLNILGAILYLLIAPPNSAKR